MGVISYVDAWKNRKNRTYAVCFECDTVFEDDSPLYGSLYCPFCSDRYIGSKSRRVSVYRGLREEKAALAYLKKYKRNG